MTALADTYSNAPSAATLNSVTADSNGLLVATASGVPSGDSVVIEVSPDGHSWLGQTTHLPRGANDYSARIYYGGNGISLYSNAVTVTGNPSLATPTSFSATPNSNGNVGLAWGYPTVPHQADLGVEIDRSDDGGTQWTHVATLSSPSTTYTDSLAREGETARYRIRCWQTLDSTIYGYSQYLTTTTPVRPAAPDLTFGQSLSSPAAGQVDLFWTDKSQGEDGYKVEWSTSASFTPLGSGAPNPHPPRIERGDFVAL